MNYESTTQRILPLITAVTASTIAVVVVTFIFLERQKVADVSGGELVTATDSLKDVSNRLEVTLDLAEGLERLRQENLRLREQITFVRDKNELLELQLQAARDQGYKFSTDDKE